MAYLHCAGYLGHPFAKSIIFYERMSQVASTTRGAKVEHGKCGRTSKSGTGQNSDNCNGYIAAFLSSPYGYYQLVREIYGGVIDHLEVPHIANIWIPDAPIRVQQDIGQQVVEAFEKKDQATLMEKAAIKRVEEALEKGNTNIL